MKYFTAIPCSEATLTKKSKLPISGLTEVEHSLPVSETSRFSRYRMEIETLQTKPSITSKRVADSN